MSDVSLVPEEQVNEYLGIHPDRPVQPLPVSVNLNLLNWGGRRYADVGDLIRMLRLFARRHDDGLLASVADQISQATGVD